MRNVLDPRVLKDVPASLELVQKVMALVTAHFEPSITEKFFLTPEGYKQREKAKAEKFADLVYKSGLPFDLLCQGIKSSPFPEDIKIALLYKLVKASSS